MYYMDKYPKQSPKLKFGLSSFDLEPIYSMTLRKRLMPRVNHKHPHMWRVADAHFIINKMRWRVWLPVYA